MNKEEFLLKLRNEGVTDNTAQEYYAILKSENPSSFDHPVIKDFVDTVYTLPFDTRVQDIISHIAEFMSKKGVETPCMHGCSEDCVFHELENK